ncbi:hypothetical protein IAQ61_002561, partial [Plenodomus lingam]|uniref:uncharacterized protein n=1 Tax=Leptosphaeria maculans TaxID=5022 RepID=UPI00331F0A2F
RFGVFLGGGGLDFPCRRLDFATFILNPQNMRAERPHLCRLSQRDPVALSRRSVTSTPETVRNANPLSVLRLSFSYAGPECTWPTVAFRNGHTASPCTRYPDTARIPQPGRSYTYGKPRVYAQSSANGSTYPVRSVAGVANSNVWHVGRFTT